MNYSDIQHRFANKLAGKNGCLKAGNVKYYGRNYYSYSTIFGQWVDISKNVVVIFDGSTSPSSSKHKLYKGFFPDAVNVFPYDCGSYYGWRNCNLVGEYADDDKYFDFERRCVLMDYYVASILSQFEAINGGKKKGLEKVDFSYWDYVEKLCEMYKDTTISKYIKHLRNGAWKKSGNEGKMMIKLAKLLSAGERDVKTITDSLFGEGTFKKYWDYCARYRKSADKRAKVEALCARLGIASPYESWTRGRMDTGLTADQIRKLTAKERVELHFKSLAYNEYKAHESERREKYNKNFRNAYKWIVGSEPKKDWHGYEKDVDNNCVNKDNGVVYECSGEYIFGFYWLDTSVSFDYDSFRNSEDKKQWIADFYAKCKEVALTRKAIGILTRINAHYKGRNFSEKQYINDDYLRENTTEAEYAICEEFIRKQDKYFADQEVRRRAAEIERIRREEEERKEREYMEQVKQEQIQECVDRGADGMRDLWRLHLTPIYDAKATASKNGVDDNFFYRGGNVLLRLNLNKDKVETSKDIRIPVDTCKKMWKIVSKWHENPSCFKPMQIDTKCSGRYTISSYQNDILTAGCHKIAYTEMERVYNEIINA